MIAKRIAGTTHYLGAPVGWDPARDGECGALAVRVVGDARAGHGYCESAWEPTPAELEALQNGGQLVLRIVGWQPPVALYVERPKEEGEHHDGSKG